MTPTWEDIAEGQEMAAKAMTMQARGIIIPAPAAAVLHYMRTRYRDALLADAADTMTEAARARVWERIGAPLDPALAHFLAFSGTL